jgi:hypothetical protein
MESAHVNLSPQECYSRSCSKFRKDNTSDSECFICNTKLTLENTHVGTRRKIKYQRCKLCAQLIIKYHKSKSSARTIHLVDEEEDDYVDDKRQKYVKTHGKLKRRRCLSTDTYDGTQTTEEKKKNPYDDKNNVYKDIFNSSFVALIIHYFGKTDNLKLIIMDGESMRTTKTLLSETAIKKSDIIVIERDEHVHTIHEKAGLNSFNMDLSEFFSTRAETPYDCLCIDACGSVQIVGESILLAIQNGYVKDNTILATTFSKRSAGGTFVDNYEEWKKNMGFKLAKIGLKYENEIKFEYGGGRENKQSAMCSSFFHIVEM